MQRQHLSNLFIVESLPGLSTIEKGIQAPLDPTHGPTAKPSDLGGGSFRQFLDQGLHLGANAAGLLIAKVARIRLLTLF